MNGCVDILLATYNGEKYFSQQIQSILAQTHSSFRILIRDDHSTDNTRQLIQQWKQNDPERIIIIEDFKRLGVKGNFSALMEHSTAPYIMFCDQDDIWDPNKIARTLACLKNLEVEKGTRCPILVHTDLRVVDQKLQPIHSSFWKYSNLNPYKFQSLNRLLVENVVTGCTVMINRPLLDLAWPIPKDCIMHDWWLALTAAAFGKIGLVQEATLSYRQHGANTVGAKKYGPLSYLLYGLKKWRQPDARHLFYKKNFQQAGLFFQRFKEQLKEKDRLLLAAYLQIPHLSFIESRYLMLKHHFLKNGWLRNIVYFTLKCPKDEALLPVENFQIK